MHEIHYILLFHHPLHIPAMRISNHIDTMHTLHFSNVSFHHSPYDANKKSGMARIAKMMHKDAAWLEAHPQYKAYSWDFHFDETKHQDGFYYHFTQCPLNTFARKEGYLEVLPIMCDIDYKTATLMHAKLYRDHTLAGSGEVCDYWFVGDKVENPK